jgi:hypothetical protein
MVIKVKEVITKYSLEVTEEELRQIYRLLRKEIEGAEYCEATTYEMYHDLKTTFGGVKK